MYLKYLYLHVYYKFRSSTVTDKQQSVSLNEMFLYLSAFIDFVNMFIRYRLRHHTSEILVMATEMVSTVFFSCKEIILAEQKSQ